MTVNVFEISCEASSRRRVSPRLAVPVLVLLAIGMLAASGPAPEMRFADVTSQADINYIGQSWGASWGEFNGDGFPDLWASNHFALDALYLNNGDGTFRDISAQVASDEARSGDSHGGAWADFDNDGDQDLLILQGGSNRQAPNGSDHKLWVNEDQRVIGRPLLLDVGFGLARGRTPLWIDLNRDGRVDIVASAKSSAGDAVPPLAFMQSEDVFEEVTAEIGFAPESDSQIAYVFAMDIDGDRVQEIVYRGRGFTVYSTLGLPLVDVTADLMPDGLADSGVLEDSDIAVADFNGDLRMDMYLTRMHAPDQLLMNAGGTLKLRSPVMWKRDQALRLRGRSVVAGDFDNDMDVDLYIVATGERRNHLNVLYENLGNAVFKRVPDAGGAAGTLLGRGDCVAMADYDADGFLDLFVANGDWPRVSRDDGPYELFRNLGNGNHWLQIDLEGSVSNRDGIGATVLLSAGGVTQIREQSGGMHNKAQNHTRLHFGLAGNTNVDTLTIHWPSGRTQVLTEIDSNQILHVIEPDDERM
ncbi:CRTAC1 family protein [Thiocapsa sp.]|uniref:CRTAC1 family protein n=1 Tax=Thiocapsa sp. TaxID=2024551 RepID=UPI00359354F2